MHSRPSALFSFAVVFAFIAGLSALPALKAVSVGNKGREPRGAPQTLRTLIRQADGEELVIVVLGSSHCGASQGSELARALLRIRDSVRLIAHRHSTPVASIGVALDDDPLAGLRWLNELGGFDEMDAGQHLLNTALNEYVWREPNAVGATPQVILQMRRIQELSPWRIRVAPQQVLIRMVGVSDVLDMAGLHDLDSLLSVHLNHPSD